MAKVKKMALGGVGGGTPMTGMPKPLTPPPSGPVAPRGSGAGMQLATNPNTGLPQGFNGIGAPKPSMQFMSNNLRGAPATPAAPVGGPVTKLGTALGKPMKTGGTVSASKRADGIAQKGKTKGRMC